MIDNEYVADSPVPWAVAEAVHFPHERHKEIWHRLGSGQMELGFHQLETALRAGESKPPPDRVYHYIKVTIDAMRDVASARGEAFLFDNLHCGVCGCGDASRGFDSDWFWSCNNCGSCVNDQEALEQLEKLHTSNNEQLHLTLRTVEDCIDVFNIDDLASAADNASTSSSDENASARLKHTVKRLIDTGTSRPFAAPSEAWQSQLDKLREQFPNFIEAIDEVLEPSFAIAAAGGRARPPPLLLVGAPGVGKSYFASLLAALLKTPMFKIDMASASSGSSIDGLATHWANSAPGEVFKALAWGRNGIAATSGPIGFLDEIDKVGNDLRYDPIAPLYSLLEVESAKNFEDQSLPGIRINASYVRWIACANCLTTIPKPILTRFHIVHVESPTASETAHMFERIFCDVVAESTLDFDDRISKSMIQAATKRFSAREFKTRCVMAIGKALARNRRSVEATDFGTSPAPSARKMGF